LPNHGVLEFSDGSRITEPTALLDFDYWVVYRTQSPFEGEDTFTFNADDGGTRSTEGVSNTATVKVAVRHQPVNRIFTTDESDDDGYATPWNRMNILDDTKLFVGSYVSGIRFKHMDIPRGSKILTASLGLSHPSVNLPTQINGIVQAEAVGNAGALAGTVERYLFTLPRTNASTAWIWGARHYPDGYSTSPDFSEVVQEIVNRGDWSSGNAMLIILSSKDQPFADMRFFAYDYYHHSAFLTITYAK